MAETTRLVETDIIPEQEFALTYNSSLGAFMTSNYNSFLLTSGDEYQALWGDQTFTCTAFDGIYGGEFPCVAIGNPIGVGGSDNGLPFIIGVIFANSTTNLCVICALEQASSKVVRVYQTEEIIEETDGVNIVLKDRNGDDVVYEGVKKVALTDVDGNDVIFSEGELMEGLEIDLDMSSGDQTVEAPKGYLAKKATIKKPETLRSENIQQGVDIAGVVGTLETSIPAETTIEPDFSEGDMVVIPEDGTLYSKVTIPTPDTLIPENIADGINIAGIIGTLAAGGGGGNVKIASGTATGSTTYQATANHNLGVIPDLFVAYLSGTGNAPSGTDTSVGVIFVFLSTALKNAVGWTYGLMVLKPSSTSKKVYRAVADATIDNRASSMIPTVPSTTTLSFGSSTYRAEYNKTYNWFAIGGLFS